MKRVVVLLVMLALLAVPGAIDKQVARRQIVEEVRSRKVASAQALLPALPGERFISVPGNAFRFTDGPDFWNANHSLVQGSIVIWDKTYATAPVQLPHGAKITYFAAHMVDSSPSKTGVLRLYQARANNNVVVAQLVSPNNLYVKEKEPKSKYTRIANRIGGYFLEARGVSGELEFLGIDYVVIGFIED